ncbi:hypothetical protein NONO_c22970 [Nocardia nova SH22a]|uniref:Uncharacterized protein n=1 Tax=Nocardia nova SH22a TaxID=1415166 RepID=W5TDM5_9NOCA|nr:hypothetical protein [Nocardia nova]AHH17093.1 hypothetical protein NONO_c22970 [Nocardia nova SH22a]
MCAATELTIDSDYRQIHLFDSGTSSEPWSAWGDDPIVLAEDAAGIRTGVNGDVTVVFEMTDGPVTDGEQGEHTVVEFSLSSASGRLLVTSPTWGAEDAEELDVPPGRLRLRVSLRMDPWLDHDDEDEDEDDGPADRQRIRIRCWPSAPSAPVIVKN